MGNTHRVPFPRGGGWETLEGKEPTLPISTRSSQLVHARCCWKMNRQSLPMWVRCVGNLCWLLLTEEIQPARHLPDVYPRPYGLRLTVLANRHCRTNATGHLARREPPGRKGDEPQSCPRAFSLHQLS